MKNYGEDNSPIRVIKHRKKTKPDNIIEHPNLFSGLETNDDN